MLFVSGEVHIFHVVVRTWKMLPEVLTVQTEVEVRTWKVLPEILTVQI